MCFYSCVAWGYLAGLIVRKRDLAFRGAFSCGYHESILLVWRAFASLCYLLAWPVGAAYVCVLFIVVIVECSTLLSSVALKLGNVDNGEELYAVLRCNCASLRMEVFAGSLLPLNVKMKSVVV